MNGRRTSRGRVVVVTGASRGIGRGVAIAFGELGDTVYVTGRTSGGELSIETTAELVGAAGGRGIPVLVDHGDDAQIAALFERVGDESGRLDVLVNNVYKIPDPPAWQGGFWEHPVSIWDDQVGIGLRAHYVAAWYAAPLLFAAVEAGARIASIMNISSPGGQSYHFSASYGAGKAGLDRLSTDMAHELAGRSVASCSICPGIVATEFISTSFGMSPDTIPDAQTPLAVGRCVAALAGAPDLLQRSGGVHWVEDLAREFEIIDEYGRVPAAYPRRR